VPDGLGERTGPITPWSLIVPAASSQTTISAEAVYLVYGFGASQAQGSPWTLDAELYARNATASSQIAVALAAEIPVGKFKGNDTMTANGMIGAVAQLENPEVALGFVGAVRLLLRDARDRGDGVCGGRGRSGLPGGDAGVQVRVLRGELRRGIVVGDAAPRAAARDDVLGLRTGDESNERDRHHRFDGERGCIDGRSDDHGEHDDGGTGAGPRVPDVGAGRIHRRSRAMPGASGDGRVLLLRGRPRVRHSRECLRNHVTLSHDRAEVSLDRDGVPERGLAARRG
jgi:hypothetical protein